MLGWSVGSEAALIVRSIGLGAACLALAGCSSQWRGDFTWAIIDGGVSVDRGDGSLAGEERSDGTLILEGTGKQDVEIEVRIPNPRNAFDVENRWENQLIPAGLFLSFSSEALTTEAVSGDFETAFWHVDLDEAEADGYLENLTLRVDINNVRMPRERTGPGEGCLEGEWVAASAFCEDPSVRDHLIFDKKGLGERWDADCSASCPLEEHVSSFEWSVAGEMLTLSWVDAFACGEDVSGELPTQPETLPYVCAGDELDLDGVRYTRK